MTGKIPAHFVVLLLALLGGSACYAQGSFSQATPISGSQFFGALKAVSLDLRSDPSLAKYISLADQESEITKALAGYGIAVRPNMQVTLVVTAIHHAPVMKSAIVGTGEVADSTVVHGIYIVTEFFLKTAALRNGKLHLVMAAPARSWSGSDASRRYRHAEISAGRPDGAGHQKAVYSDLRGMPAGHLKGQCSAGNALVHRFLDGNGKGGGGCRLREADEPRHAG